MIIDAHNHPGWYGYTLDKFLANMDQYGISQTWLLSWEAPQDEYDPIYRPILPDTGPDGPISFSHCLAFREQAPDRFILGYAPDPRRPGALERFRQALQTQDVRVFGELKLRMMQDSPDRCQVRKHRT